MNEFDIEIINRQNKLLNVLHEFTKQHLQEGITEDDVVTTFLLLQLAQINYILDSLPSVMDDFYSKIEELSKELKALKNENSSQ